MLRLLWIVAISVAAHSIHAQSPSILGDWQEPAGSVIRIERCAGGLCMRIVAISPQAPSTTDLHNPDPARRSTALCHLLIGSGFHSTDTSHASGGTLYDPKTGNTYRGSIALDKDVLRLRGYVGLPLFGRTETWRRATSNFTPCHAVH